MLIWTSNLFLTTIKLLPSYLSKQENDCSQAMNQAVKEAAENNLDMHTLLRENVLCNNQ